MPPPLALPNHQGIRDDTTGGSIRLRSTAAAISTTVRTAACSARTAGTRSRMRGGTTAAAHEDSKNNHSVTTTSRVGSEEAQPRPVPKIKPRRRPVDASKAAIVPIAYKETKNQNILQTFTRHRSGVCPGMHRRLPQRQRTPERRQTIPRTPSRPRPIRPRGCRRHPIRRIPPPADHIPPAR